MIGVSPWPYILGQEKVIPRYAPSYYDSATGTLVKYAPRAVSRWDTALQYTKYAIPAALAAGMGYTFYMQNLESRKKAQLEYDKAVVDSQFRNNSLITDMRRLEIEADRERRLSGESNIESKKGLEIWQ